MNRIEVKAAIWNELVKDTDDVPKYNEGVCRYWPASPESPLPEEQVFVVFSREPCSRDEAFAAARDHFL